MAIVNNAGGTTGTSGSAMTKLIAPDKTKVVRGLNITNEGGVAGWLSFDGATKHLRIPAGPWQRSVNLMLLTTPQSQTGIWIVPDSGDMTSVFVELLT